MTSRRTQARKIKTNERIQLVTPNEHGGGYIPVEEYQEITRSSDGSNRIITRDDIDNDHRVEFRDYGENVNRWMKLSDLSYLLYDNQTIRKYSEQPVTRRSSGNISIRYPSRVFPASFVAHASKELELNKIGAHSFDPIYSDMMNSLIDTVGIQYARQFIVMNNSVSRPVYFVYWLYFRWYANPEKCTVQFIRFANVNEWRNHAMSADVQSDNFRPIVSNAYGAIKTAYAFLILPPFYSP
jgi:hypothetical protein